MARPIAPRDDAPTAQRRPPSAILVRSAVSALVIAGALAATALGSAQGALLLLRPGEQGSAAGVFHRDFPRVALLPDSGHDGQQFYAIARQPMHLEQASDHLDRPRYRAQRILLPALAWLLQPQGGGTGLVWALFALGVLGVFAGCCAVGLLTEHFGGRGEVSAIYAVLPGTVAALALGGSDALATGLALVAVTLLLRGRTTMAVLAAVLAVLAKESILLLFVGVLLWRRRRDAALIAIAATGAAGLWWLALRVHLPRGASGGEFAPLRGLAEALGGWVGGSNLLAASVVLTSLALGLFAIRRHGLDSFAGWIVLTQLALVPFYSAHVIELNWNATRALLPLDAVLIVALASPPRSHALPAPGGT